MSRPFHFKQFSIRQDHAAMKVGTDSVLLGSWVLMKDPKNILDVGCGTGLLSLMMAQRFTEAQITGIDIEPDSLIDARFNIDNSKWADRVKLFNESILEFTIDTKFDLVITNPPYFPVDTLAPDQKRALARSGEKYSFQSWMEAIAGLLSNSAKVAFILPIEEWLNCKDSLIKLGFNLFRICYVRPNQQKEVHRVMIELQRSKLSNSVIEEEMIIEKVKRHDYSEKYKELTRSFYLKMH